jgi:formamidopyrimidine-DNA glycosylase
VLGLRFGMTGRLVVDGRPGVEELQYSSHRDLAAWDRFGLALADGGRLRINDPRRLGGVELDPDEGVLGIDAGSLTLGQLRAALGDSTVALKARLMDQGRIGGIGNLLADEILWRAGLDPARPARSLGDDEVRRLHRTIRAVWKELLARGGSHLGRLQAARVPGGRCPRDGEPLERRTIGGRTTYSCPRHQR